MPVVIYLLQQMSRPSRARGLKLSFCQAELPRERSRPSRARGLKLSPGT